MDFNEVRHDGWQCHQLVYMEIMCTSLQTPHSRQITMPAPHHLILQAGCSSCHPTNGCQSTEGISISISIQCHYLILIIITETLKAVSRKNVISKTSGSTLMACEQEKVKKNCRNIPYEEFSDRCSHTQQYLCS